MAKPVALYFVFILLFLPTLLSAARMSAATGLDDRYNYYQTKRKTLSEVLPSPTTATLKPKNANVVSVDMRSSRPRFQILPKGSPIPPSGPSKGHNGINSTVAGLDSRSDQSP